MAKANKKKLARLIKRAKKIGMTEEMIATYPDATALKNACDAMSPQSNPDARPSTGKATGKVVLPQMPDKFEIDSKLEARFVTQNRARFDENNLQLELRRINRRFGPSKPVKIVKIITFEKIKGVSKDKISVQFFVTHYEIFMK